MNTPNKRKTQSNGSTIKFEHLNKFEAFTANQKKAKDYWDEGKNLFLSGSAGTGKSFLAISFGLTEVLASDTPYDSLIIVRSMVPTRNPGFLPGDEKEKKEVYEKPYKKIAAEIAGDVTAYNKLTTAKTIQFETTSFIRGLTVDNSILVVDECQNLIGHELDSVITRVGVNCRIIFSGDHFQSDFTNEKDKRGMADFMRILKAMPDFAMVEFGWSDIVRSDFVRDYIMTKEMLKIRF